MAAAVTGAYRANMAAALAVAVGLRQAVFLQVSPDAEPGPLHPPLTLQPGLVPRVRHREDVSPVGRGAAAAAAAAAAAVSRGGHVDGGGDVVGVTHHL
ncbi:hypothetical protein EYF80_060153 [Liparis tanakae]|uniref:Uncharacterized protein n=1 Tax=Liparis tanakae TaxID=230148 RepID=A0A4Z2EL63_9TELE|nr:hypothetical protein EYF80_060153 [Liparis tanakae]